VYVCILSTHSLSLTPSNSSYYNFRLSRLQQEAGAEREVAEAAAAREQSEAAAAAELAAAATTAAGLELTGPQGDAVPLSLNKRKKQKQKQKQSEAQAQAQAQAQAGGAGNAAAAAAAAAAPSPSPSMLTEESVQMSALLERFVELSQVDGRFFLCDHAVRGV